MPRVIIVQVVFNNKKWIRPVFESVFNQSFKDFKFVAVIAGNDDGSKELIASEFPEVEIIDPGFNIGFAKGHNLVFERYKDAELFQLVNPDLILEPNYIEEILKAFDDEKVGAATGKLYKIRESRIKNQELWGTYLPLNSPLILGGERGGKILDTTGVIISKSGRARDRGQHEADEGQYDNDRIIQAVSGAGAMYRRTALESIKYPTFAEASEDRQVSSIKQEYFDEDFHSYWEDVDLAWRMTNNGWKCAFVPSAVGYHGRTAGSSRHGYLHVIDFIKHHKNLPEKIRKLNYQNHIFMYIKNSRRFFPQFFIREFFMFIYILFFEISTLKVLPQMIRLLPKMWKKGKIIKSLAVQESQ